MIRILVIAAIVLALRLLVYFNRGQILTYEFFKDFAAPIATAGAALAAAFVAYRLGSSQAESARIQAQVAQRNWQTANERVVLDLFERRIAVYEGIRHVVAKVMTSGQPGNTELFEYVEAIDRAPFYFGREVTDYLERIRIVIIDIEASNAQIKMHDPNGPKLHYDRMIELNDFYKKAPELFGPYIQAHQKV
jgi:hypothetical protein